jgi:biotin carboxyl carrier protein
VVKYLVTINDLSFSVDITECAGKLIIEVNGRAVDNSVVTDGEHQSFLMLLDNRSFDTEVYRTNGLTSVMLSGREFPCLVEDERLVSIRKQAGLGTAKHDIDVKAPMPGMIVKLLKVVGDRVKKGESLLLIEAMKMENELKAPAEGTIKEVHVQTGRPVDKGQTLITLADHGEEIS